MKTCKIWTIDIEQLKEIVKTSCSITEVLEKIGYKNRGHYSKILKERLMSDEINFYHLYQKIFLKQDIKRIDDSAIFCVNSTYSRSSLKRRILQNKYIPYVCSICKMEPTWNNKKLVLVLDHINGINNDNRLDNLRFVCPNCNSQLDTFAGRHLVKNRYKNIVSGIQLNSTELETIRNERRSSKLCNKCGKTIHKNKHNLCKYCYLTSEFSKKKYPHLTPKQVIDNLIKSKWNFTTVGKLYNVSSNAIVKWLKTWGINPKDIVVDPWGDLNEVD